MFNTEIKNSNFSVDHELCDFIKTKSYFPNIDIKNKTIDKNFNDENKTVHIIQNTNIKEDKSIDNIVSNTEDINQNNTEYKEFLQEIALILTKLCDQIQLKEENKVYLVESLISFIEAFMHKLNNQELEYKKILFLHFKKILGEEFQNKILLIKRASSWLGLNNLEENEEYINFLYRLAELGSILSEDQGIKNEQHSFVLTKEEAKKERNALISDDKFKNALTNKMHPLHKDVLHKLRNLNSIIVS